MNHRKRIAAILMAALMTMPAYACAEASKPDSSGSNSDGNGISQGEDNMIGADLTFQDNPNPGNAETTAPAVTTTRGEDGSIYVNQTDINGTTVTVEGGSQATELYTGTTLATTYAEPTYQSKMIRYQAFWLDMSQKADYVFDGEFLVYDVKISENAPDGVYPITFEHVDFSNWDAHTLDVKTNVGYVCVNTDAPEAEEAGGGELALNANVVSGKQGDTVQVVVSAKNNSGFVGFNLMIGYDSNAMSIVSAGAGSEFATRAKLTAHEVTDD